MPICFTITLRGLPDEAISTWFSGMTVTPTATGSSLVTGQVRDQAELHGLLRALGDLVVPIESLQCHPSASTPDEPAAAPVAGPTTK